MSTGISITELRQRLFQLADRVADTGEPILIERRGVRLRLVRDDDTAAKQGGRLARLVPRKQSIVIGPPLDPHESPAEWSGELYPQGVHPQVAEPGPKVSPQRKKKASRRRRPR